MLIIPFSVEPQSRKELEKERKHILDEIRQTKKELKEISLQQRKTINYLRLLQRQISYRESLINTMQDELGLINQGIAESSDIVAALENDLDALKQEYARLIYYYYKNRGQYSLLSYIFSANSFHQGYSRMKLLRYYAEYRKKQIDLILKTEKSLMERMTDLKKKQAEKVEVLKDLDDQKKELEGDQYEQKDLIKNLKMQGNELQKEIRDKTAAAEKLEHDIKNAIAYEIKLARDKDRAARNNRKKSNKKEKEPENDKYEEVPLTPEGKALSERFSANKGRLPWPVGRGEVCVHFGKHSHPSLPGIIVNNIGIKIRTEKNSMANAIFDGEVRAIFPIDAQRKFVLIKHGDYFTVYSNLKIVMVKPGQKVKTKQTIGVIAEDSDTKNTTLELQIWKGGDTKLNPEQWLAR